MPGITKFLPIICLLFTAAAFAQNPYAALDWNSSSSLYNYLLEKAHNQYDQRRLAFREAIRSKQKSIAYIKGLQKKCRELFGTMPASTPLHAVIKGSHNFNDYQVEKVVYESFPGHHVTANLYKPAGNGRFPALLFFCGHEDAAKATESYQLTAMLFAKNGFLVFVIDPISQGERLQLFDAKENALARVGKREHTLLNETSCLVGTSTAAYQLWDNKCGLDYLVRRADVDSSRIGCIGNSGGGMQAIYFSAFEQRIKVTAVCSYLSSRQRMYDLEGPTDGCVELPNEGRARLEMSDYLIARAPRPLLVLAGRFDSIDFIGTQTSCSDLKSIYDILGVPDRFKFFVYDDGHGISKPKRAAAVNWFRKWFSVQSPLVTETGWLILKAEDLMVTATGQVNTDYPDEASIAGRNCSLFDSLKESRRTFLHRNKTEVVQDIKSMLNIVPWQSNISATLLNDVIQHEIVFKKMVFRRKGEIPLPLVLTFPKNKAQKVVLWLYDGGKNKIADSSMLVHNLLQQGSIVILADVRGTGETADKPEYNEARYSNKEYRNALLSLHIGEPIVGQRTKDVLALLDYINTDQRMKTLPVEVNASGVVSQPALYAALFSDKISHVNLYHSIRSFNEILHQPIGLDWYSWVVPNVLRCFDLPDLVSLAGPGRIQFHD